MRRLEVENRLMQELSERGAEPTEARRLAAVAEAVAQIHPSIDSNFADSLETLLRRERPPEAPAKIIAITRNLDAEVDHEQRQPRLYALPGTASRRISTARFALRAFVAAAVILFALLGIPRLVNGAQGSRNEVQPRQYVPQNPLSPNAPGARTVTSRGVSVRAMKPSRAPSRSSDPAPPEEIIDSSSEACPVAESKNLKAGRKTLSVNCPSAYAPAGGAPRVASPPSS